MSRAERLLELMQLLRNHRYPVTAQQLSSQLNISTRTLYRDIATLQQQGAEITGEAGLGYVLRPGFTLPPLMFTPQEIAALVLGSRWVARRTDAELASAAENALSKIASVLPPALRSQLELSPLMVGPATFPLNASLDVSGLIAAIDRQQIVQLDYLDAKQETTRRRVWPLAIGWFDHAQILAAWCELREDFRHFRLDRIATLDISASRYPQSRTLLLKTWREKHNIPDQSLGC